MRQSFRAIGLAAGLVALSAAALAEAPVQSSSPGELQKKIWDDAALSGAEPTQKTPSTKGRPAELAADLTGGNDALLPDAASPAALPGSIRSVVLSEGEKLISLTFDLCEMAGERSGYDASIINYLRQQGVKATFYAGGLWMRSHSERALQLMADPLFELGNHGWSHRNMKRLPGKQAEQEVLRTQAEYQSLRQQLEVRSRQVGVAMPALAKVPPSYRFPFGTCSADNLKLLEKYHLPAVQWSIVTGDPSPDQTATAIAKGVLAAAKPGAIIIAHANGKGRHTAESLPLFIPQLRQQGFRFVTVSELLHSAKRVESAETCFEVKPGDNKRYDRLGR